MQKIQAYFERFNYLKYVPLLLILAIAAVFYLRNLGSDYITLWDEAVHVNVVKNLAEDPWPPKLHLEDFNTDFKDWTNNHIWVHKPLLPLYIQALFYKISPTLFAFRLPAAVFAGLCTHM
jgi:4-amino-4-deoxy-L-arabinose transferase-like glycosyltransferase